VHILIFANCQGHALSKYLGKLESVLNVTYVPNYRTISLGAQHLSGRLELLCQKADLLIYQPLDLKWGIYSSMHELFDTSKRLSIPYVYIDGLWPAYEEGKNIKGAELVECVDRLYPGLAVDKLRYTLDSPSCHEDVAEVVSSNLLNRLHYSFSIFQQKESLCDVKIMKWLSECTASQLPMFTQNHPKPVVISQIFMQVCSILSLTEDSIEAKRICSLFEAMTDYPAKTRLYQTNIEWPALATVAEMLSFRWDMKSVGPDFSAALNFYIRILESVHARKHRI
jgi:hypothetical protein